MGLKSTAVPLDIEVQVGTTYLVTSSDPITLSGTLSPTSSLLSGPMTPILSVKARYCNGGEDFSLVSPVSEMRAVDVGEPSLPKAYANLKLKEILL